jgi:cystathionine gamma-lyase/methionine-gamma-lyase
MTHATCDADEWARHGVTDGLIGISVGLEDYEDLSGDLLGAME